MIDILLNLLRLAYLSIGIVGAFGYLPTVKDLYLHKRMSANINSYLIWTITSGIAFMYSLFILPDILFRLISGMNFGFCSVILVLSIQLNRSRNKKHRK